MKRKNWIKQTHKKSISRAEAKFYIYHIINSPFICFSFTEKKSKKKSFFLFEKKKWNPIKYKKW